MCRRRRVRAERKASMTFLERSVARQSAAMDMDLSGVTTQSQAALLLALMEEQRSSPLGERPLRTDSKSGGRIID